MKPILACLLVFAAVSFSAAADNDTAVPISQEPHHHLVLENEYTRVYDVTVPAHQSTLLHRHDNDYLAVILEPAEMQIAVLGRPVTTGRAGKGEVRFAAVPVIHRLMDNGDTPFRNLIIEILKKKSGTPRVTTPERGLDIGHGGLIDTVVDNSQVRVQEVQIAAGGMLHKHSHKFPFLVVALSDLDLHNMPQGKPEAMVLQKAGEVKWIGAVSNHEMMNAGKQQAHFIEVEFK
jgi:quercetin dioxygenase-like cupin family protein